MIKIITVITALKTSLKYAELMLLKHFRADALFERSLMESLFSQIRQDEFGPYNSNSNKKHVHLF